jgi:TRAP-type C4-dicarboxylate transport system permease large subunit
MGRSFGQLRGGLGISVVAGGRAAGGLHRHRRRDGDGDGHDRAADHAARGLRPSLASGIVCTAGTLGQIIPPSTLLIILADVMSNAYQQAQYEQGKFSVEALSVGQFFAAAIIPGLLLVTLYLPIS